MPQINCDNLVNVYSELNYLDASVNNPEFYLYKIASGAQPSPPKPNKKIMPIYDLRGQTNNASLDSNGFQFITHSLPSLNYFDQNTVQNCYYPHCCKYVAEALGASHVHAFDHNIRDKTLADIKQPNVFPPVRFVHNDYTEKSAPVRVKELMGKDAKTLIKGGYAFINVWRPLQGPVTDEPLAICDAATIKPPHLIAAALRYEDRTGSIYSVYHNKGHRWFYLSKMQDDEVMLIKCFDSSSSGTSRYTAHTSFRLPDAELSVTTRRSIEVRTIAFFGDNHTSAD
jgi:hypothetical protein